PRAAAAPASAPASEAQAPAAQAPSAPLAETRPRAVYEPRRQAPATGTPRDSKPTVVERARPQPAAPAGKEAARPARPAGAPTVINLARGHATAPSLDDQQQG